jgi:hypothetical protein
MLHKKLQLLIFIFCCGWLGQSCNIINPKETVPTYIRVDSFLFQNSPAITEISYSHYINNVWVYYNNIAIGAFDLPATFPIMATGTGKLQLVPGITENGRNDLVIVYPFYVTDTSSFAAQPGKIINYTPKTTFYSSIQRTVISDFNFGLTKFAKKAGNINMINVTTPGLVFEGGGSGGIYLNAVGDSSEDSTNITYTIPTENAFIEFNYKTEVPFYVGLQANLSNLIYATPYYLAGISPNDHWQKFYLNVSDFAKKYQGTTYSFYIKAVLGPGQTSGKLLIDNIQLISF